MSLSIIILAAGLGTRMKSSLPKVLHALFGKPVIRHVVEAALPLGAADTVVVVGPESTAIRSAIADGNVRFAVQTDPKGTGDALKAGIRELPGLGGTILVMNGDTPLITTATLRKFLELHRRCGEAVSLISFHMDAPHAYGRLVRQGGDVAAIVEERDATGEQRAITEVNSGIYAIESSALHLLDEIAVNVSKDEYYLTDIVGRAVRKGYRVGAHIAGEPSEFTGINTREELHRAGQYLRERIVNEWIENGVSFIDTRSAFIHPEAEIGADTILYQNVCVEGRTIIGSGCVIYPNTRIIDSTIGNGVTIKDSTVIESSTVRDGSAIGPFAHLRPGSVIGSAAKIGNFVEVKKSVIGDGSKASHLSYLGDAEIGRKVNIGAGTITCNYDGRRKHKTVIEDDAFIGSDTQLVAPVRVGKGAYVGAGSTITKDVPPQSLALSRAKQRVIEKWVLRRETSGSHRGSPEDGATTHRNAGEGTADE